MAAIELRGIKKSFSDTLVIPRLNLTINDKEFLVVLGPSGCGKSTMLRIIAGLDSLDEGDVLIGGRRVNEIAPAKRDLAMVFQDYALYPHMSVFENMAFSLRMRGFERGEIDRRVREAANLLRLGELLNRKPRALSGGQRQRVAMGRAIVRQPQAFLFDEPFSNLDAKLRNDMRIEMKRLSRQLQSTMIFVTHDQVEAMTLADRIIVMKEGVIQQAGTPDQVYQNPVNMFVAGFIGAPTMNFIPAAVARQGDAVFAELRSGAKLELPAPLARAGRDAPSADVVLGVRPEYLRIARADDKQRLTVQTEIVEPLGADRLLIFSIGKDQFVARLDATARIKAGDQVALAVDLEVAHLFSPKDGVNFTRRESPTGGSASC